VLVRNPQNFLKDRVVQNSRWLLGTGLLTAEGDAWKRQRRFIQPAFSRDRIADYAGYMTGSAEQMLASWRRVSGGRSLSGMPQSFARP
jgi:cytochrome P450